MSTEVKSGGSLAWAIMARSLFSRLGTGCLLYLYVINVIYLVPNKAVKKTNKTKKPKKNPKNDALPSPASLLTDVVVLTPSDEKLPSAYPSAKLNSTVAHKCHGESK
jgi:hypothetical protein